MRRRLKTGGRQKGTPNKATALVRELRARQRRNRPVLTPEAARAHQDAYLQRVHGIDRAQYDARLAAQGGRCAACGDTDPGHACGRFRIDADRATGQVRGLLCMTCVTIAAYYRKQAHRVAAVGAYLQQHSRGACVARAEAR